jgi:hypothetical protein
MSDEKLLTKEIAEQFVDDPYSADGFSEFTAIEDDAAEVLAKFDEFALDLSGLAKLSDTAVGYLSKCEVGLHRVQIPIALWINTICTSAGKSCNLASTTLDGQKGLAEWTIRCKQRRNGHRFVIDRFDNAIAVQMSNFPLSQPDQLQTLLSRGQSSMIFVRMRRDY